MILSSPEENLNRAVFILSQKHGLRPVLAAELEFYLPGAAGIDIDAFESLLDEACRANGVLLSKWEREQGPEQFEIALASSGDVADAVRQAVTIKRLITMTADEFGISADFRAKPHPEHFGSGLHVHVHLEDSKGNSVYYKKDQQMSDALRHSIGGLLATLQEAMCVFAPSEESYKRFVQARNAPLTMSWGANNRTVAIRLPDVGAPQRHIEHRVAGADADIAGVCAAVLAGISVGLSERIDPGSQTYGDVSIGEHGLPALPHSLQEAKKMRDKSEGLLAKHGFVF